MFESHDRVSVISLDLLIKPLDRFLLFLVDLIIDLLDLLENTLTLHAADFQEVLNLPEKAYPCKLKFSNELEIGTRNSDWFEINF